MPRRAREPGLKKAGSTELVWGTHAALAAWANPDRRIRTLWLMDGLEAMPPFQAPPGVERPRPQVAERRALDRLTDGAVHQGIVLECDPLDPPSLDEVLTTAGPADLLLMLDQVTDPHNVGAVLRSAAAFGARAVLVHDRHTASVTGTLAKSASGALEHVPLVAETNLARTLERLTEAGYACLGLAERGGRTLAEAAPTGRVVLVLGAEGTGLRRLVAERCTELVRLPTQGPIGSLNVSNAAAVALYEVVRGRA